MPDLGIGDEEDMYPDDDDDDGDDGNDDGRPPDGVIEPKVDPKPLDDGDFRLGTLDQRDLTEKDKVRNWLEKLDARKILHYKAAPDAKPQDGII